MPMLEDFNDPEKYGRVNLQARPLPQPGLKKGTILKAIAYLGGKGRPVEQIDRQTPLLPDGSVKNNDIDD